MQQDGGAFRPAGVQVEQGKEPGGLGEIKLLHLPQLTLTGLELVKLLQLEDYKLPILLILGYLLLYAFYLAAQCDVFRKLPTVTPQQFSIAGE